jgi:hypothetical protein
MHTIINRRIVQSALVLFATTAPPAFAQTAKLTAPLEKGQVLRYDLAATIEVSSKATEKLSQHARLRLTVAEIDEDGEATLRGSFESLDATWKPADGDEQTFAWKEGQELAEDAPPLAKTYGSLGATPVEITVSRKGEIKTVDGPDKALEAGNAAKLPHPERALGAFAYHALPQTLAPIFTLDPDGKDRKAGDTWTATAKLPAIGGASVNVSTERTLKNVKGSEANIAAKITQSWQAAPGKVDPTTPVGTPSEEKGTADERWDTRAGRLVSRTQDLAVTWKLELQTTPPMESSRTVTSHVELRRLEPDSKPAPGSKP